MKLTIFACDSSGKDYAFPHTLRHHKMWSFRACPPQQSLGMERWLGSALARHTGQMEGKAIGHIWARLGILLQRGNAALLGNRVPELPLPAIDGIE